MSDYMYGVARTDGIAAAEEESGGLRTMARPEGGARTTPSPEEILADLRGQGRAILSDIFHGPEYAQQRADIIAHGKVQTRVKNKELVVRTRPIPGTNEYEVMAMAAISRDPGLTSDAIDLIQDFAPTTERQRAQEVTQLWNIYTNEGVVNNAVNKIAALLSTGGTYKVKRAKKGKLRKAQEELQEVLDDIVQNINMPREDGVITGARGAKAVNHQAVRFALVEGSWIGRQIWAKKKILVNGTMKAYEVPINIHSISTAEVEPIEALRGTGIELFYWKPNQRILQLLEKTDDKVVKDAITKFLPKDLQGPLKKDKKVLLDPALLGHIKHRGVDIRPFGESFIKPAYAGIRYKRAVEALDLVSMENLINRLTIVMVGSSDPKSPYSKTDVAMQRQALMQSFFEEPGPNMTIVWQGDDVKVQDVGAHTAVLDLDDRHRIAEAKVKVSLGVPEALLSGSTTDGKASGWAAALGASSEMEELRSALAMFWTTLGERVAAENGFEDVLITFEFDNALMVDKAEEWNQLRQDLLAGAISYRTYHKARGFDTEAEYIQKCREQGIEPDPTGQTPESTYAVVFKPLEGLAGQGTTDNAAPPGKGGGNTAPGGRPAGNPNGNTQRRSVEDKSATENR